MNWEENISNELRGSGSRFLLLAVRIGFRNLIRHRRRSLITMGAVAFAVFCLAVFQSLLNGLEHKMMESALLLDHGVVQIHGPGHRLYQTAHLPIPEADAVWTALDRAGVKKAARRIKAPALLLAGARSSSVELCGIVPEEERQVTFIHRTVVQGSYRLAPGTILISKRLAQAVNVHPGGDVKLLVQTGSGSPRAARLEVSGLFHTGLDSFDLGRVFVSLATAQKLLETPGDITEIAVGGDPRDAETLARKISENLKDKRLVVRSWRELAPDLAQLMELNRATFRLLTVIVFIIAALGVANTMTTVIFERFREFGTLTALGTTPGGIVGMVVIESALLGVGAALVGTLAAAGLDLYLAGHGIDLARFTSANQYFVAGPLLKPMPAAADYLLTNLITVTIAVAAGLYPAWKAAMLDPVKALTHV